MPLLGTCPRCRAVAPIGAYLADAEVRAAWEALEGHLAQHPILSRVLHYLDLHAPDAARIHGPKAARLLGELGTLIRQGTVSHKGATHPATFGHWALGMDAALDAYTRGTLRTPLPDGFGWLTAVVASIAADPERQAAARALDTPATAAAPSVPAPASQPAAPAGIDPGEWRELLADLRHWSGIADRDAPAAAPVMARLTARYQALTGRPWRGRSTTTPETIP